MLPDPIKKFVDIVAKLPSIGPRQATRLAFHLINGGKNKIDDLSRAITGLTDIKTCGQCFFTYTDTAGGKLCHICSNSQRHRNVIAIVEKETDLISLEKTKKFTGRYLVLGALAKEGILDAAQKLRLAALKSQLKKELAGPAKEIVIAVNPTTYGDLSASVIAQELKEAAEKITRLGRGIPTGGEIEFADEDTLSSAIQNRS